MQETIRKLLLLQKYDLEILDLDRGERELQDKLSNEQREFDEQIAQLESERDRLKHCQVELKELELELESRQDKRRHLEAQQAAIKRNVEYKAMMKEILDTQAAIRLTEDKILEKYEEIEQETQQTAARDKDVTERRGKLQERLGVVQADLDRIGREASEAKQRKAEAAQQLEERVLRLYRRIFRNKKGAVVVPIVNRSCGGCHLSVTPQTENMTRHQENIVQCENCARILYVSEEESETDEAAS